MTRQLINSLSTCSPVEEKKPLAPFSTFNIGGPADLFVSPKSVKALSCVIRCLLHSDVPLVIIGGGSNILISDEGFPGVVIHPLLNEIHRTKNNLTAGSGVGLQKILQYARKQGLSGLEHLTGIPGSLGGAIAGNAGTSSRWISSTLVSVHAVEMKTGNSVSFDVSECNYSYRNSIFKYSNTYCITAGTFHLTPKKSEDISALMSAFMKKRTKQPTGNKSAGCIFKNPDSIPAGKLIDELGLKGKKIGAMQISSDHGNFMLNTGGGHASDVIKLISYVKQQARDKRGIQLQEEVRYIGF